MKTLIAILFLSVAAQAQVSTKLVPLCSYWRMTNDGYTCGSYPMSESIVDPISLNSKISNLENRIQILENKINHLEAQLTKEGTHE
jgi:hypothetical protein